MGELKSIPFKSHRSLREWEESGSTFDDQWAQRVLIPGMKNHFKNDDVIHICDHVELGPETFYVDVHMELEDENGHVSQPWVLTFTSKSKVEDAKDRSGPEPEHVYTLEELNDPFPSGDIVWDCSHFTEEEVVSAMEAWAETFWPDADLTFEYKMIDDNLKWLRGMIQEAFELGELEGLPEQGEESLRQFAESDVHHLGPSENITEGILVWLEEKGCPVLQQTESGLLIRCTEEVAELVETKWSGVFCEKGFEESELE